jgi:hypothetical protein
MSDACILPRGNRSGAARAYYVNILYFAGRDRRASRRHRVQRHERRHRACLFRPSPSFLRRLDGGRGVIKFFRIAQGRGNFVELNVHVFRVATDASAGSKKRSFIVNCPGRDRAPSKPAAGLNSGRRRTIPSARLVHGADARSTKNPSSSTVPQAAVHGVCDHGWIGTTSTEFAGEPLMIFELTAT